jgi:hypothetical protein
MLVERDLGGRVRGHDKAGDTQRYFKFVSHSNLQWWIKIRQERGGFSDVGSRGKRRRRQRHTVFCMGALRMSARAAIVILRCTCASVLRAIVAAEALARTQRANAVGMGAFRHLRDGAACDFSL